MRLLNALAWTIAAIVVVFGLSISAGAGDDPSATPIRVTIHDKVLHSIDSRLFGQFMERPSWGSEIGAEAAVMPGTHQLRPEAKRLIRNMQIPVARFPGGTDVDYVDWLDMIDNVPGRGAERPITVGHTGNRVTNFFGYDEFLRLCNELKIESILVVNFRDGLLDKDGPDRAAQHAAKLAAYANAATDAQLPGDLGMWPNLRAKNGQSKPYGVKYFQIGNETWAFWRKASLEHYIKTLKTYINAIHAVDPTVQIIADGQPVELATEIYRRLGERVDYFAVHHYQPWQIREVQRANQTIDAKDLSAEDIWYAWVSVPRFDVNGQSVLSRSELDLARKAKCKVAMTEWNWNGWWGHPIQDRVALNSLYAKGVGAAGILHAIIRQGDVVRMAAQSMLIGDGWGIHAICCDRHGRFDPYMVPSGQVTMLYCKYHGDRRLAIDVENMPHFEQPYRMAGIRPAERVAYVDILATRSEKTLYLHAINRHFHQALPLRIDASDLGEQSKEDGKQHVLEGRLNTAPAAGELLAPGRIRTDSIDIHGNRLIVQLPARSVTAIEVPLQ